MNLQDVSHIHIPDGDVRMIHDSDNRLLWGAVGYNVMFSGSTFQRPNPSPEYPQQIQTVTGEQTVNIHSKNLFATPPSGENRGVTYTLNQDGTYSITGKATGGESLISVMADNITIQNGDSVYLSSTSDNANLHYRVEAYNGNTWLAVVVAQSFNMPTVVSLPPNTTRLRFGIGIADGAEVNLSNVGFQLEKSSSASAYTPYSSTDYPISLGSLELCELGTYQDRIYKDSDSWKVHKATATITLNGDSSENWYIDQYAYMLNGVISAKSFSDIANMEAYCGSFTKSTTGQVSSYTVSFWYNATGTGVRFIKDQTPDLSSFRNWLNSNNQTVYYPLAAATDTAITDANLIAQLDAIYNLVRRYGYTFVVSASGSNLPIIIDRTLL